MKPKKRTHHSTTFKAKVALEAVQEKETINQIAERYGVSRKTVSTWKNRFLESSPNCFSRKNQEASTDKLFKKIHKLEAQINWLKKIYESTHR